MTLQITLYETTGRRYHATANGKTATGNRSNMEVAVAEWVREYLDAHPVERPPSNAE